MKKYLASAVLYIACANTIANGLSHVTEGEISHLLSFIKSTDCTFIRNSRPHDSAEAYEHISKKYRYVLKKGLVETAEDFVRYSATKSSISGKRYSVICDDEKQYSGEWLLNELARYRKSAE